MNTFEQGLYEYFSESDLAKLTRVKIGIAGAGGLGSNCCANLIRCGIKNMVIIDFDKIEKSNLNRQFYFSHQIGLPKVTALKDNLLQINPAAKIKIFEATIKQANIHTFFKSCDIVVEALDKAHYKSILIETLLATNKFIVSASGLAGFGKTDDIKTHRIKENLVIIGDLSSEVSDKLPPLAPRVNIAAAKQADAVLEYILKS